MNNCRTIYTAKNQLWNPKVLPQARPIIEITSSRIIFTQHNPYSLWKCGFNYFGKIDALVNIPNTKVEFAGAVNHELANIEHIQSGLRSYIRCINSGKHHVFSKCFLRSEETAASVTISQLQQIRRDLEQVIEKVQLLSVDGSEVAAELREAFRHAQPWVRRSRAVLVSSHVFYKINYVLCPDH